LQALGANVTQEEFILAEPCNGARKGQNRLGGASRV
jgi:hypothetical protein